MNREIYPKVKIIMTNSIKEAKNFDDVKLDFSSPIGKNIFLTQINASEINRFII